MKYFIKTTLLFLSPAALICALLAVSYVILDPFHVLYSYDDYSQTDTGMNRDYVSTEMFIKNNPKQHYNSFIFGSSRSLAFHPSSWHEHLKKTDRPFAFDASAESIYGIWKKFLFLKKNKVKIDNALFIFCRDATFNLSENHIDFLFIKHPLLSGESWFRFHYIFARAYTNPDFLYHYYRYKLTGKFDNSMMGFVETKKTAINPATNEFIVESLENELKTNEKGYYAKNESIFYTREGEKTDTVNKIDALKLQMLKDIVTILKEQKTQYKVVISPLYEQKKFSEADQKILRDLFEIHLYDFSGDNTYTASKYNYYETSHYRSFIADSIMQKIYP